MPEWTKEQKQAIEETGSNILVAAAAGSGKTTVLVERIIQKIINDGIDIDKLLIVTFTNAAASEMRERILSSIYKKIDEDPNNVHLQRQIVLLNRASICTIDSFCLDIVKNNFFNIGISPNFRIADNTELELLKQEAIEDLFEKLYESREKKFENLIDAYAGYRGDETLKDIILRIYGSIQSNPFPEEWIEEKVEEFNVEKYIENGDFSKSIWGKVLVDTYKDEILDEINSLKVLKNKLEKYVELEKYVTTIGSDIEGLNGVLNALDISWNEAYEKVINFKFGKWPLDRKISMQLKDEVKVARDIIKEKNKKMTNKIFLYNSKEAFEDINSMYSLLSSLKELVFEFTRVFSEKKQEKNIMDFNDIEHAALKILTKKTADGKHEKTDVAKKLEERFEEIAIDEYQDSNLVQEFILTSVSRGNNIFMVGDVKQSIYKFRQARPELFLEKYNTYGINKNDYGLKIKLFKNFRSRESVLDITNLIFDNIMSKKLGDIEYDTEEYLNFAANFEEPQDKELNYKRKAELHVIDLKEDESEDEAYEENIDEDNESLGNLDNVKLEKVEIEAKYVAMKVKELVDSKYQVFDKKYGYRDVQYKDIVILLRATNGVSNIFEKELYDLDIPVFSDVGEDFLETIEIERIISILKIIDNPFQDIPLLAVLRSPIYDFSDEELTAIRLLDRNTYFYNSLELAKESDQIQENTKRKIEIFINSIKKWRREEKYLKLNELIWRIYIDTGYYSYVGLTKNGEIKQANLKLLFEKAKDYESVSFKGLFNFIRYIERIKNSNSEMGSAKIIGENENVVRIMSIHKSKGLEFPIVFLSRTDKQINMRSLNENILIDQDIGLGPKYINYDRKIEYNTAAREAVRLKSKKESISEEMRVLYVALTRAKEKLFIVGVKKDFEKDLEKKKDFVSVYEKENNKINHLLIQKYTSYLDWIELVYLNNLEEIEKYLDLKVIKIEDIKIENELSEEINELSFDKERNLESLDKLLNWQYENIVDTLIPSKTSVTKIKELAKTDNKELILKDTLIMNSNYDENVEIEEIRMQEDAKELKPNFMKDDTITGAHKGTIMHLCLEKLDIREEYTLEDIRNFINTLEYKGIITEDEKKTINIYKIKKFMDSNIAKRARNAIKIEREKPFYTFVPASKVYNEETSEKILVQGIIDLYFVEKDGNVVLVDYKTDYVENKEELKNRYKIQLELYKKALENSLKTKINDVFIYSISLEEEIKID